MIYIEKKKPNECGRHCVMCGPEVCGENVDWDGWIFSKQEGPIPSASTFEKAVESTVKDLNMLLEGYEDCPNYGSKDICKMYQQPCMNSFCSAWRPLTKEEKEKLNK